MRLPVLLVSLLFLALLLGCASRFERTFDDVRTADEAVRRFGTPTQPEELADGGTRREWRLHTQSYPEDSYGGADYAVSVGGYWSGFGVWLSKLFGPGGGSYNKYCTVEVVTNEDGVVVQKRWQGNGCDQLLLERQ